ncbi:MAG TPA: hypothetical protein VFW71_09865 [Actinomycetota bacterium]|nr:hypothetical protein [Actinomycetota bacterium]
MRPTRWGYLVGLLVIVAGGIGAGLWVVAGLAQFRTDVKAFQRVPANGGGDVHLTAAGNYVLYNESPLFPADLGLSATVTAPGGTAPLPLARYGTLQNGRRTTLTYNVDQFSGDAADTFSAPAPGTYHVASVCTDAPSSCATLAVGKTIGPRLAFTVLGAVFIGLVGFVLGVVLIIATFARRRRARRAYPPPGEYPYPYQPA